MSIANHVRHSHQFYCLFLVCWLYARHSVCICIWEFFDKIVLESRRTRSQSVSANGGTCGSWEQHYSIVTPICRLSVYWYWHWSSATLWQCIGQPCLSRALCVSAKARNRKSQLRPHQLRDDFLFVVDGVSLGRTWLLGRSLANGDRNNRTMESHWIRFRHRLLFVSIGVIDLGPNSRFVQIPGRRTLGKRIAQGLGRGKCVAIRRSCEICIKYWLLFLVFVSRHFSRTMHHLKSVATIKVRDKLKNIH